MAKLSVANAIWHLIKETNPRQSVPNCWSKCWGTVIHSNFSFSHISAMEFFLKLQWHLFLKLYFWWHFSVSDLFFFFFFLFVIVVPVIIFVLFAFFLPFLSFMSFMSFMFFFITLLSFLYFFVICALFKAAALWADAFYKSKWPSVCLCVRLCVHFWGTV